MLTAKFAVVLPQLDERQRRLLLGAEARALGRGGIARVAAAAGVSRPTVTRGVAEVKAGGSPGGRVRKPGGGRKSLTQTDPGLLGALKALVDPVTRGDPMSPLRWTTKSTRQMADALTADDLEGLSIEQVRARLTEYEAQLLEVVKDEITLQQVAPSGSPRASAGASSSPDPQRSASPSPSARSGTSPSPTPQVSSDASPSTSPSPSPSDEPSPSPSTTP